MNYEFLAFKYSHIELLSGYESKQIQQLGWKCRKYQNWNAVHNGDSKPILKAFGDYAVEEGKLDFDLLPEIYGVLFNVQRWRFDKEELAVEPPRRKYWDQAMIILQACNEKPGLVLDFLSKHYTLGSDLNLELIPKILVRHFLANIVLETCNLSHATLTIETLKNPLDDILHELISKENLPWEVDLLLADCTDSQSLKKLDLPEVNFVITREEFDAWSPSEKEVISHVDSAIEGATVGYIKRVKGVKAITFNTNNHAFRHALKSDITESLYRLMVETNLIALDSSSLDEMTIQEIQSAWGIALNKSIRKQER